MVENRRSSARFFAVVLSLLWAQMAVADGRFEIIGADYREEDGMWIVDARLGLELSSEALEALESGVALTIQTQIEVTRRRRAWPDALVEDRQRNIQLSYLSLSQRYLIKNLDSGEQESYATLYSALRQIGRVRDFPVIATEKIKTGARYIVSLRVVLNQEALPGPLQVLIFWRGDFSLESEWYRWKLN
jgi:hypothetical protein